MKLMLSLISSIFLHACETWTITKELQGKIRALEMRCLKRLLNITYRERITNNEVRSIVTREIGPNSELLAMVIRNKLKWFGHIIRSTTMYKTLIQGNIDGKRRRGRPKMQWHDNIVEWTGLGLEGAMLRTKNREGWKTIIKKSTAPLRHTNAMG